MYRWYAQAEICYAYLPDVPQDCIDLSSPESDFARSRWFTRGWTLQELLAPKELVFYSRDWTSLGTKPELVLPLSAVTKIDPQALRGYSLAGFSVAQKMSWASKRVTTRPEDTAYCLLGLFDVNMPLLYGEGSKAFGRLQEELMKTSNDQSLFAWGLRSPTIFYNHRLLSFRGLLAESPAAFASSGDIVPISDWHASEPYTMTNKGLQIRLPLIYEYDELAPGRTIALLNCRALKPAAGDALRMADSSLALPLGIVLVSPNPDRDET